MGEWIGIVIQVAPDAGRSRAGLRCCSRPIWLAGRPASHPRTGEEGRVQRPANVFWARLGTRKRGLAHAMHEWSGRKGPFVAVNCATLVPDLGGSRAVRLSQGAFTGADRPSPGFFRAAQRGAACLDEVTDLPEPVQGQVPARSRTARDCFPWANQLPWPSDVRVLVASQISHWRQGSEPSAAFAPTCAHALTA